MARRTCDGEQHFGQALLLLDRTRELARPRDADASALFRYDDDDRIGLFGEADGGAMARSDPAGDGRRAFRERKKAAGGNDAVLAHDRGTVVQAATPVRKSSAANRPRSARRGECRFRRTPSGRFAVRRRAVHHGALARARTPPARAPLRSNPAASSRRLLPRRYPSGTSRRVRSARALGAAPVETRWEWSPPHPRRSTAESSPASRGAARSRRRAARRARESP